MQYSDYCKTCANQGNYTCQLCIPYSSYDKPPTNYEHVKIEPAVRTAENGAALTVENDTYCNSCANLGPGCKACVKIAGGPPRNYRAKAQRRGTTKPYNVVDMAPYEADVMRTAPQLTSNDFLIWAGFGLCEAGEVQNALKKYLFQGEPYSREKLVDELGDLFFYMVAIMNNTQITLNEIVAYNVEKRKNFVPGQGRPNE